jgi:hypothetical protein
MRHRDKLRHDSDQAIAKASLQRPKALPFQPVDRVPGRMCLGMMLSSWMALVAGLMNS